MRKTITIILIALMFLPAFCQNGNGNETVNMTVPEETNITKTWYEQIPFDTEGPEMTTLTILIVLVVIYLLGKLAFKLMKWAIIIIFLILIAQILL